MSDEPSKLPESPARQMVGVPAAIVIAGGLIALAIYFGGGKTTNPVKPAGNPVATTPPAAAEPTNVIGNIRPVSESDHLRGPANAKVTIIEYSDIECPFCKKFHPTLQKLMSEYPNDIRWVFRHFPLEQLHADARPAALASECAGEQGKFWEMLDAMFAGSDLGENSLKTIAKNVGVANSSQFASCLTTKKYDQTITDDMTDAAAAGARGTPYSVIIGPNGEKEAISGAQPYEKIKAAVQKALAQ